MAFKFNPFTGKLDITGSDGGVTTGSVDNAVLRADGTGGATLQNSGLIIEDTIVSFAVTGVAATDTITATGSTFSNGQPIRFTALTGGAGLVTTTNYYVINVSGATFQVSTSVGGGASLFTTNITAGNILNGHSVAPNVTLSQNTTETNSALVLTPKGTGAFILGPKPDNTLGGGNARGSYAVDLQITRGTSSRVASGTGSVAGGQDNTASNFNATAFGYNNSATGLASVALGAFNLASGNGSFAVGTFNTGTGGNTASGSASSCPGGFHALANRYGMFAYANGSFNNTSGSGDAQRARFVLRCKTTTNTGVEMALDGTTTYLGIPSGKIIACTINITGSKSDGTAVAHYLRQYCVKNVGGTSSEVYAPVTIGTDNAAGTTIALSANNADDTLRILVTGITSETWRWVASVDAVEVAYGT
jgi:hypothetical protein